ncbi:MAG: AraC family transcriptional regulator, partial [Rhodanobacter sp.]
MPRTVAILACPQVQMLDVSGPLDVFAEANRQSGNAEYALRVVGVSSRAIETSSGTRIVPSATIAHGLENLDTLLIAGAPDIRSAPRNLTMLDWVRCWAPQARRYGSICSGAFILAASGVIDGRRITTHWNVAADLQRDYPDIIVEPDAMYLRDGPVC